jgi:hypothetical protein
MDAAFKELAQSPQRLYTVDGIDEDEIISSDPYPIL